jgi:hypothetical protein
LVAAWIDIGTDCARHAGMEDQRSAADRLAGIEGADEAALGITPPPEPAPDAAQVDDEETLVPGAKFGDRLPVESKPWFTSLAAESDQAGVGNDPPDTQEPQFPPDAKDPRS